MSYHLVKLHPQLAGDSTTRNDGLLWTRAEKEAVINAFYEGKQVIPLCMDHCGASQGGFVVPESERIGQVVDLFNDAHGQMLAKLFLRGDNPAFQQITRETHQGVPWGVSVWIDVERQERGGPAGRKHLTHVALTRDPYFADHNTFMRDWSPSEGGIDEYVLKHSLYSENEGECYAGAQFIEKLKGRV